jgi:hypothetical protein
MDDAALLHLVTHMPQLLRLTTRSCKRITYGGKNVAWHAATGCAYAAHIFGGHDEDLSDYGSDEDDVNA